MKDSFLMLIIGVIIGAIITATGFMLFDNNSMDDTQPKQMIENVVNNVHDSVNQITENMKNMENNEAHNMVDENVIERNLNSPKNAVENVINSIENRIND